MTNDGARVRVYIATSLDGFIAGEGDDLSWLPEPGESEPEPGAVTYEQFTADVGAMLMGRRTYDVVRGFYIERLYACPVLVASRRSLGPDTPDGVRRVDGSIDSLVAAAREAAEGRDEMEITNVARFPGGMVQLTLVPSR